MSDVKSTAGLATSSITSPAIPGTPTNVSATLTAGNVRLDWTAADALATAFNIYESTDGGSTFSYFDSVTGDPATSTEPATTYTATDLTAETTPKFYVTAEDASGESAASSHVGVAIPSPVTGVSVSLNSTDTTATIHWTAVTGAIGYYVDRIPDDGSAATLLPEVTPGTVTSEVDTGLDPTKAYSWTVNAVYPVSSAIDGSGSSGGGSGGSGGGGTGGSGSGDGSAGSSTGTGTDNGSDPADDASQEVGNFHATVNSDDSVTLSWSYQGSASFEIEEQDPTQAGTNFYFVQSTTGRTVTLSGFAPGNRYPIRVRADRADGTVSDYQDATANIPDSPPPDDDDSGLEAPSVDLTDLNGGEPGVSTEYYGTVKYSTSYDLSDGYNIVQAGEHRADDPLNIASDLYCTGFLAGDADNESGIWGDGTPGESYKVYFYTADDEGHRSPPASVDVKLEGSIPTALSLTAQKPDASGNTEFDWTQPDVSAYQSSDEDAPDITGTVSFYSVSTVNGNEVATLVANNVELSAGSTTLHLPTGDDQILAVYNLGNIYGSGEAVSPYSNRVHVDVTGGPPAAPTLWTPVYVDTHDPSDKPSTNEVDLAWKDNSKNETGFKVYRLDPATTDDPHPTWKLIKTLSQQDATQYRDQGMSPGGYQYEVLAYNDAGM